MSVVCVLLFLSTFRFRCWGYKNSRGARWAGSFCSPLCELATLALPDPYFSRNRYIQVRSGILSGFFLVFGLVAVGFLFSVSWPSGCFLLVGGLVFLLRAISRCFFFGFPSRLSGFWRFSCFCLRSCILHLSLLG